MVAAAVSRDSNNLLESRDCSSALFQAGEQFAVGNRLLDEIRSAGLHGLHRHRHAATAGDDDSGQPVASVVKPAKQLNSVHSRKINIKQEAGGSLFLRGDRLRENPRGSKKFQVASFCASRYEQSIFSFVFRDLF